MTRQLISSGSSFERSFGYSRAVVDDEWVFVSGCTGFDYSTMTIADDVVEQTRQCFRNIIWALDQAESSLNDIVRVRCIVVRPEDWAKAGPVLGEYLGDIRPANTTIVSNLIDPRMKIEIEVTARKKAS